MKEKNTQSWSWTIFALMYNASNIKSWSL